MNGVHVLDGTTHGVRIVIFEDDADTGWRVVAVDETVAHGHACAPPYGDGVLGPCAVCLIAAEKLIERCAVAAAELDALPARKRTQHVESDNGT